MTIETARDINKHNAALAIDLYRTWKELGIVLNTIELAESVLLTKLMQR